MNADPLIKAILVGDVVESHKGHLVHPLTRIAVVATPSFIGLSLLISRRIGIHIPLTWLSVVLITILLALHLDFRRSGIFRTFRWTILWMTFCAYAVINNLFNVSIKDIPALLPLEHPLMFLRTWVSGEDLLVMLFFATSAWAIARISIIDVIWAGRMLLARKSKKAYYAAVITFFVVKRTLTRLVSQAFSLACNKARLARQRHGQLKAAAVGVQLFVTRLLHGFVELASQANSLLTERGALLTESPNRVFVRTCVEDWVAGALLVVSVIVSLVLLLLYA